MPDINGPGGFVTFAATDFNADALCTDWSATIEIDVSVLPPPFNETWEYAIATVSRMTGSLSGILRTGTSNKPWALPTINAAWVTGAATLTAYGYVAGTTAGTAYYSITEALFSRLNITRPHNGPPGFSCDFRSSGAVTLTWPAT